MPSTAVSKRDRWIPWAIVAFFVCFIALLSGFAWIAFHSYTGEVTENAYKKGLAYNADIAHANAQAELGWKTVLEIQTYDKITAIVFSLRDASNHVISDATVTAYLSRPTQAGHDLAVALTFNDGTYRGMASLKWKGIWDIRISATRDGYNYQQSKTVILQ